MQVFEVPVETKEVKGRKSKDTAEKVVFRQYNLYTESEKTGQILLTS